MARMTAQEFADKWGRRLKAAQPDIVAGVKRVTQAPGVKAAAQQDVMLNNLAAAVTDGTWAKRVAGVSLADWQNATANKGAQRIAAGVDGAAGKVQSMAGPLLSAIDAAVAVVEQTPRGDIETNINRSATFAREMAKNAPRKRG
jgi:hypothetical protein